MATRVYDFPVFDTNGDPLAGLTPTWASYYLDGGSTSGPAISETGNGWYRFTATLTAGQRLAGNIDCGATAASRYYSIALRYADVITPADSTDWTSARAAYLDAAVTSRAEAATALSTATWTGTKAGYLDAAVSSRLAAADYTAPPSAAAVAAAVLQGTGTRSVTITAQDSAGSAVPGARVDVLSGSTLVTRGTLTNTSGQTTVLLDDGTYTLRTTLTGWSFDAVSATVSAGSLTATVLGTDLESDATAAVGLTRSVDVEAPSLAVAINGWVEGDGPRTLTRNVTSLPATITAATLTVKRHYGGSAVATLTGTITDSGADGTGQVTFSLTAANSAAIGAEAHVYDVVLTLTGGRLVTVEKGTLTLTQGVA